jgi:type IV pili sensor histidine kinase/response regulator
MELTPQAAQQNLLLQVVDVSLPANMHATVGDALRHLLLHSGYSLCYGSAAVAALYDLPLPAAHRQLGPLSLHDALLTLAGPAWDLQVDDVARHVCFVRADVSDSLPPVDRLSIKLSRAIPEAKGDQP